MSRRVRTGSLLLAGDAGDALAGDDLAGGILLGVRRAAAEEAAGLAGRCEVVAGDFFEALPSGGDVYILKNVIDSFEDDWTVRLLQHCHRAMASQGKLLVVGQRFPVASEIRGQLVERDQFDFGRRLRAFQ